MHYIWCIKEIRGQQGSKCRREWSRQKEKAKASSPIQEARRSVQ